MKKLVCVLILGLFCSLSLADVVIGPEDINLTDREVKQLLTAKKQQTVSLERSGNTALRIELWFESKRHLAETPTQNTRIDNAILVARFLLQKEQKLNFDNPPTARIIKQETIDDAVRVAQVQVAGATKKHSDLVAAGADQADIDAAQVEVNDTTTILIAAQAVTVEDFIITP